MLSGHLVVTIDSLIEAPRGNCYAPARSMYMMIMIDSLSHAINLQKFLKLPSAPSTHLL